VKRRKTMVFVDSAPQPKPQQKAKAAKPRSARSSSNARRQTMVFSGEASDDAGAEVEGNTFKARSPAAARSPVAAASAAAQPRQTERFCKVRRHRDDAAAAATPNAAGGGGGGAVWLFGAETDEEGDGVSAEQKLWMKDLRIEQLESECEAKDAHIVQLEAALAKAQRTLGGRRSSVAGAEENTGVRLRKRSLSPGALLKSKAGLKKRRKKAKLGGGGRRGPRDTTNDAKKRKGSIEHSVHSMRTAFFTGHGSSSSSLASAAAAAEDDAWGDGDESMSSMR
jgi:hypothetical protein